MYFADSVKMVPLLISVLISCTFQQPGMVAYDFSSPDAVYVLPDTLREVSGITKIKDYSFACIQDENGIIFIYDLKQKKLTNQYTFHINGDYEGIAYSGRSVFVLRSDGTLFEINDYSSPGFRLNTWDTGIPADNNEGLAYDIRNNRLLIGCKSKIGKGSEYKDKRVVYAFDLNTKKLSLEPVFEFDLKILKEFALQNQIPLRVREKKKGEDEMMLKFRISAIGIHPLNGDLYILSATDYMLFVFDKSGKIKKMNSLNSKLFNKAEGISFFENGDLLITNEGQGKVPTLLRFNYKIR